MNRMQRLQKIFNVLQIQMQVPRTLVSMSVWKLDEYEQTRKDYEIRYNVNQIRKKIESSLLSNVNETINENVFTTFLHIAKDETNDINLIYRLLSKYCISHGFRMKRDFNIAPVLFRYYHHFKLADEVIKVINSENLILANWTNSAICRGLIMDILYESGKHEELSEFYSKFTFQNRKEFSIDSFMIMTASLFQLNTQESYEKCMDLYEKVHYIPFKGMTCRALGFTSLFTIKMNEAHKCLHILEKSTDPSCNLSLNLQILAHLNLGNLSEVWSILRLRLTYHNSKVAKELLTLFEAKLGDNQLYKNRLRIVENNICNKNILVEMSVLDYLKSEIMNAKPISRLNTVPNSSNFEEELKKLNK